MPIVADEYVDVAFGTGCVKMTPAPEEPEPDAPDQEAPEETEE